MTIQSWCKKIQFFLAVGKTSYDINEVISFYMKPE